MYSSWDMEWDRQNYLSFWAIFCPFTTPSNNPENQILKKKKKKMPIDIILLYIHMYHEDHIYGSWNIWCDRHKFSSFWVIFCLFNPLTIWKIKILTLKKTPGDIIVLHICTINDKNTWCMVPKIWRATDIIFVILNHFLPFYSPTKNQPKKSKFWKHEKTTWSYYHITQVNHKWQSYDVWFLR